MLTRAIKRIPGSKRVAQLLGLTAKEAGNRQFLLDLLPKRSIGAEIGVHLGEFSQAIIDSVSPKELHLIDPWEHQESEVYRESWYGGRARGGQPEMDERYRGVLKRFDAQIRVKSVCIHRSYSTDALAQFPDGYLDWVYIDGNHLYEFVAKDLELSFKKVKPGGYITGDDYQVGYWWGDGVKRAVDEFRDSKPVQLVQIRDRQFMFRKVSAPTASH